MSFKNRLNILYVFFGLLIFPWFIISGLSMLLLETPSRSPLDDAFRHYVVLSTFLYPLYVGAGFLLCRQAVLRGGNRVKVFLYAGLPLLSALPWLSLLLVIAGLMLASDLQLPDGIINWMNPGMQ